MLTADWPPQRGEYSVVLSSFLKQNSGSRYLENSEKVFYTKIITMTDRF